MPGLRALALIVSLVGANAYAADDAQLKRGEYLFNAGGCTSCR